MILRDLSILDTRDPFAPCSVQEGIELLDQASRPRHGGEVDFWRAIALARSGRLDQASAALAPVFTQLPEFQEVLSRLVEVEPDLVHLRDSL